MNRSIFEYMEYRPFVFNRLKKSGRGSQKQLADRLRVQPAFVSQVLSGKLEFTPEQALGTTLHFELDESEREYFTLLVARARAGTPELRAHLDRKLEGLRETNRLIATRMKMEHSVDAEARALYYATWHPAAVHMALTIPGLRSKEALHRVLRIRPAKLNSVLAFLVSAGFAEKRATEYHATGRWVHLEKKSPLLPNHHRNVRLHSLDYFGENRSTDMHYSAYFSCSKADLGRIQEMLLRVLSDFNELVRPSSEEVLAGIGLDLFALSET